MGRIVTVDQDFPERSVIDEAVAVLAFGGVLVMPTDSVYGIGCAATPNNPGHGRIFGIKRRDLSQTLPWLIADAGDLMRYAAELTPAAVALATAFWPGALTLVVRASDEVAPEYRNADGTIALRLPSSAPSLPGRTSRSTPVPRRSPSPRPSSTSPDPSRASCARGPSRAPRSSPRSPDECRSRLCGGTVEKPRMRRNASLNRIEDRR